LGYVLIVAFTLFILFFKCFFLCSSSHFFIISNLLIIISYNYLSIASICNFLYFKGFLALQSYRAAHQLWLEDRRSLALLLQYRISLKFAVDIHPAAQIGHGLMIDHATGLVIGETAVVEDSVSIMQSVTLGGTGKVSGDRHPKIRKGVLIGPGAKILGNIEIAEGAMVAASSVVLKSVPAHAIVAGVPALVIADARSKEPSQSMDHYFKCD
jgi:serine O-acetyltransferase